MPSAASETVAYSANRFTVQRSSSTSQTLDGDSAFALMLEASAPPADPAPRQTDQVKPSEKTAAAPADPKKTTAPEAPEKKATEASQPAADKTVTDGEATKEAAAEGEAPVVVEDALPEVPETDETADDGVDAADADAVIVQVQADTAQPQPAVSADAAIAAPAVVAPEIPTPAQAEGEADPELAVKPVAAGVPAIKPEDVPAEAPAADAPDQPAADVKGADIPEIKGKVELKTAEQPAETTQQAADTNTEVKPSAPQDAKAEQVRPHVQHEDAKPEQTESKPQHDAKPSAEPVQNKPAATPHLTALDTDTSNTPPPVTHQPVATDVASLTAGNQRATALMAQTTVPVSGIAVEIATQAKAGNSRFEIRLDPPELGRIDVRLDVDQDGNVKSRLVIERSDTYDLLRKDSSSLERALQQAGLKTSDNGLEFSLRDQNSAQREARDQNQRNTERGIIPDADIQPAEAASGYGRVLGLGSGVDIRI